MDFSTLLYRVEGRIATITLNRPDRLNAIDEAMPGEIAAAVDLAQEDDEVHVVVTGAGRAFCSGYALNDFAEAADAPSRQDMPWDPMLDFRVMSRNTDHFMRLSTATSRPSPGSTAWVVAGGSDIALACDMVVMADDARIGYPPARVWGCPSTAMWVYRVGAERAKRMLFTGDLVTGREAAEMGLGLVLQSVPEAHLDRRVAELAGRMAGVPRNQLMMQKLMIDQALDSMGLRSTQTIATLFEGIARHTPEGMWFKRRAEEAGFARAVAERDSGEPIAPEVARRMPGSP